MQIAKQQIKQLLFLSTLIFFFGFSFTSCEKELYDDAIYETPKGTISYVNINDAPFLIPAIQEFNKDYSYLDYSLNAKNLNKDELNLNLDLEHIIKYVQANGLKSYSICIKKEFEIYGDLFFENLNIYEKDGEYKSFIFKYNQDDDTQKFNLNTFTGSIDVYDIDYGLLQTIVMDEGRKLCVKINNGPWHFVIYSNGVITVYNSDTGYSDSTDPFFGSNTGTDGGSNGPSSGGGGGSSSGTSGNPPTGPTTPGGGASSSGSETVLVPNPSEIAQVKRKRDFNHELENSGQLNCYNDQNDNFKTSTEQYLESTLVNEEGLVLDVETYSPGNIADVKAALLDICDSNTPGTTPSIIPFLIEEKIDDALLDPCTKGILDTLKQNHAIANIIARFDSPNSVFKIKFKQGPITPFTPGGVTYGETHPTGNPFEYEITLNSDYFKNDGASNLFKAKTIVHEIIHALILSIIENRHYTNGNTDPNDFSEIWNNYVLGNFNGDPNVTHHVFMGNNYVTIISQTLQEYFTGIPYISSTSVDQMCTDLAWSGIVKLLAPTTPFDSVLSPTDKARIYNRIQTESNRSLSYGLPLSSNNPCVN